MWLRAPPLRAHAGKVSMKADIFSFGVVLWEIITLERPAWRGNLRDIRCVHKRAASQCTCTLATCTGVWLEC